MARLQRPTPARTRSIRTTLAGLLIIPVLALIGLWALLATITVGDALSEHNDYRVASSVGSSSDTLLATLEQERAQTFFWLSNPKAPTTALVSSRRADDAEIARYERIYPSSLSSRHAVFSQLAKLAGIRIAVDARTLTATAAFQDYSAAVDGLFDAYASTIMPNTSLYEHTVGALQSGRALEQFTRELTLSASAQFNRGQIPAPDAALFAAAVANQRLLVKDALALANPQLHTGLVRLYGSPAYSRLAALEDQISATSGQPAPIPVLVAWGQQSQAFLKQFEAVASSSAIPIGVEAGQISSNLFLEAGLAGGLGLVAVAGVVLLMLRFGRRIRTELTDLHDGAEAMASVRLPALVERLSEGDDVVDVALASPPLATGRITEIVSVAEAFSAVQRTAVNAAVGQASLRKGVSKVFVNLSLRNQSILHRQLGMLDAMERATDDPAALADLFRLDHLTTRMRRHAESLLILSGASTGRSWREPVRLVDILRAAVAEVEDYTRIEVVGESAAAVLGPAANDVVHLVAELMENATSFSPPATKVETRVDTVGTGVAIEIEDRGLGLAQSELAAINARLDSPPGFDLAETEHLGLFVVGQLASRHRISVALRRSHYGGITAVVLLPNSVIVPLGEAAPALTSSFRLPAASLATGIITGSALSLTGSYPPGESRTANFGGPYGVAGASGPGGFRGPFEPLRREGYSTEPFRLEAPPPATPTRDYAGAPQPAPDRGSWSVQGSAQGDTYRGLPRRVRQASLAPQLHNGRAPAAAAEPSRYEPSARSPEQTRSKMSSLQDGWQRGRTDELDWSADSGGAPGRVPWDAGDGDPS